MKIKVPLLNQRGESLIAIMVTVAITALVITGIMNVIDTQNKANRVFQLKSDLIEQKNYIQTIMNSTQVCNWQFQATGTPVDTTNLNADGSLVSTVSFTKLHAGLDTTSTVLAQVGLPFAGTAAIVDSIRYDNIKPIGASSPDEYSGTMKIALRQPAGMPVLKPVSLVKNILLTGATPTARTIDACRDPAGSAFVPSTIPTPDLYPSGCSITLGKKRWGNSRFSTAAYNLGRPGWQGFRITYVSNDKMDSDDLFTLTGNCGSPAAGTIEAYVASCTVGFGLSDGLSDEQQLFATSPSTAAIYHSMSSSSTQDLDVNDLIDGNNSLFIRASCPAPTTPIEQYVRNKCFLCLGHSDDYIPHPTNRTCTPFGAGTWSTISIQDNMDRNDSVFLGFYCGTNSDRVHSISNCGP